MTKKSLRTTVSEGDIRRSKEALRDELAARMATCSDRDVAGVGRLLRDVMDELEAMGGTTAKTATEVEEDEVAAARDRRAVRKGMA